jgi:hypothetical protein
VDPADVPASAQGPDSADPALAASDRVQADLADRVVQRLLPRKHRVLNAPVLRVAGAVASSTPRPKKAR